jgi:hypothetical protein
MSRPKRWAEAIQKARDVIVDLELAFEDIQEIQGEYQDWRDNLPENLEGSPVAEKLDEVTELQLEDPGSEATDLLDEAENADLPLGFGRD